ncbi:hypothetical protein I7I48_07447 [Histoplasma ohiense]|nr:hypothetical protein I7I48_07447 [Histoplasma ohiense (nom. inval.)]
MYLTCACSGLCPERHNKLRQYVTLVPILPAVPEPHTTKQGDTPHLTGPWFCAGFCGPICVMDVTLGVTSVRRCSNKGVGNRSPMNEKKIGKREKCRDTILWFFGSRHI